MEGVLKSTGYAVETANEDKIESIHNKDKPKTKDDRTRRIRISRIAVLKAGREQYEQKKRFFDEKRQDVRGAFFKNGFCGAKDDEEKSSNSKRVD